MANTVSYVSEPGGKSEEHMSPGDTLEIKEWMRFNISQA